MNAALNSNNELMLHLVSVEVTLPGADPEDQTDEPKLEDMGTGLDWGIDAACTLAYLSKKECWVVIPETCEILYKVSPTDITLH